MRFLLFIIVFLFLFWLITTKFPGFGKGITDTGNKCYHSITDKKHIDKEGNQASLIDLLVFNLKRFGRWFRGLFKKKPKEEILTED